VDGSHRLDAMALRVLLVTSPDAPADPIDGPRAVAEAADVERALRSRSHVVARIALPDEPAKALAELRAAAPDVVLPLVRPAHGKPRAAERLTALLEWAGIPFAGSATTARALALDKPIARSLLRSRGVPVPRGFVMADAKDPIPTLGLGKRWIVKPARSDGGRGIDFDAVIVNEHELRTRVGWVLETLRQPAIVEEYVDGREFEVGIVDGFAPRALWPSEIDFEALPRGYPRIVVRGPVIVTRSATSERLNPALDKALRHEALAAWNELGLAGWASIDLRLCPERGPLVIDVNPGPDLSADGAFARAAKLEGLEHVELVERVLPRRAEPAAEAPPMAQVAN
jgi:D-alanine-D-alanine ligase